MKINLYPEMNSKISGLLRLSEQPAQMYAAALIDAYRTTGFEPDEIQQLQEKYNTAIKALSGAILEKAEIPHWISINEKLPKISDEYLVLTENGDMFNANFDKDCGDNGEFGEWHDQYDKHTLGFLDSEWSSYGGITHWMLLPQPPKGEKP